VLEQAEQMVEEAAAAIDSDMSELSAVTAERDEYKGLAQRIQADFENYKKRVTKQQSELFERAAEDLVSRLLPVLDTADLAVAHDDNQSLLQLASALYDLLFKEGLERLDPVGQPFDPNEHEAVMHEPGDGDPEVIEVMRAGYKWKGRVLRPAMVKVKG
jgi:molecular chaperone GrpE